MWKDLVIVLLLILSALGFIYHKVGKDDIYTEVVPFGLEPYAYNSPGISIANIKISAYYFVPSDETENIYSDWKSEMEEGLRGLADFHTLQFSGHSRLNYSIYDEPVVGLKETILYDTPVTRHGNPEGLKNVRRELEDRGLFREEPGVYNIILVIYEGVGAAGSVSERTAFLSRKYLSESEYELSGMSILAHEFYHTLGAPDLYEGENGREIIWSGDVMGSGRNKPFERIYIDSANIKRFGL